MIMKSVLHTNSEKQKDIILEKKEKTIFPFSVGKVTGVIVIDDRREKNGGQYPAKYRITYQRQQKYFDSGYSFTSGSWKTLLTSKSDESKEARKMLKNGLDVIEQHIKDLHLTTGFTFDLLTKRLRRGDKSSIKIAYDQKIAAMKTNGQVGTAMIYGCAIKSFTDFNNGREPMFAGLNVDWLKRYEKWFISGAGNDENTGNSYATAGIYLRSLRAIFNEAVRAGDVPNSSIPFGKGLYEIPSSPGRKMALQLDQIKKLITQELPSGSTTEKMRDLWLFSYLCNGINIKDMICLKWGDISEAEIQYLREKTKQTRKEKKPIIAPLLPEMKVILDRWGNKDRSAGSFVFGYLKGNPTPEKIRHESQNLTRQMNKSMKALAESLGLPHISTYTARHSFSNVLLNAGASVEFISEALGHSDISTTQAYLEGFRPDARKQMNSNLLKFEEDEEASNIDTPQKQT